MSTARTRAARPPSSRRFVSMWYDSLFQRTETRMSSVNGFGTRKDLNVGGSTFQIYSLAALEAAGFPEVARLPFSLKILLENLLRHEDGRFVKASDIEALARWDVR